MQILLWHSGIVLFLSLFPYCSLQSQNTGSEDFLTDQLHQDVVSGDNISDRLPNIEAYSEFSEEPLDINKASLEDFLKLQKLSIYQIEELITHRMIFGTFMTLEELQCLPSWDIQLIHDLKVLLYVGDNNDYLLNWRSRLKDPRMSWIVKSRKSQPSYFTSNNPDNASGTVSPFHWTFKYRLEYSNFLKLGIIAEQDMGERFFGTKSKYGFDFYAAYAHLSKPFKWCNELIIGDFTIGLGQGLIRHHDFGGNKSSQVMAIKKSSRRIKPYTSIQENNSLRGLAFSIPVQNNISALGYLSYRGKDASIVYDSVFQTPQRFTAFQLSGLHRTEKELDDKDAVKETVGGFQVEYNQKSCRTSVNYEISHFDVPWIKEVALYRNYQFSGSNLQQFSLDYASRYRNLTSFGEFAVSQWKGKALINGVLMTLDKYADMSAVFRYYSKNYHALNSNSFGDATIPSNEFGLYVGLCLRPVKNLEINLFADHWVNSWLSYRRNGSSYSRDYMLRLNFQKRKNYNAYFQYRFVSKPVNYYNESISVSSSPLPYKLHRIRGHINVMLDKSIEFRSRIEWSAFQHGNKKAAGILLYQDIIYHPLYSSWNCALRISIYDVGDFDSRIYAYENSVSQESSIPFYQGRGSRFYIVLKNKMSKNIKVEVKYAKDYILKKYNYFGEFNRPLGYGTGELIAQLIVNI